MVAHTFNPSTWEAEQAEQAEQADLCESEASLVYRASSSRARVVTQRNAVLKNKQTNKLTN